MKHSIGALALAAGISFGGAAFAQQGVALGTLVCDGGEGVGLILGSKKTYDCTFSSADSSKKERYAATVTKIGLDIGVTGKTTIVWSVLAPTKDLGDRPLAGRYAGAVADASLGLGAGAKILVGGLKNSVTLQPVSLQGQSGVNLAVGVGELELK